MELTHGLSKQFKRLNWGNGQSAINMKQQLQNIDWSLASQQEDYAHSIGGLLYQLSYLIRHKLNILQGQQDEFIDAMSFLHPEITSSKDWNKAKEDYFEVAQQWTQAIEKLSDDDLHLNLGFEHGTVFDNICEVAELLAYQLGQIVLLKNRH